MYAGVRGGLNVRAATRDEVQKLLDSVTNLLRVVDDLPPETWAVFSKIYVGDDPESSGCERVVQLSNACRKAHSALIATLEVIKGKNAPGEMIAAGVAAAFATTNLPLPKSRDSQFALTGQVMWDELGPDPAPEDLFPYLRKAVNDLSRHRPVKTPRGRPRKLVDNRA